MTTRQAGGIALVLLVIAAFLGAVLATIGLLDERARLAELRGLQERPLRDAANLKRRADGLASGLVELAAQGDAAAQAVIDEMRRVGIDIEPRKP